MEKEMNWNIFSSFESTRGGLKGGRVQFILGQKKMETFGKIVKIKADRSFSIFSDLFFSFFK